MTRPAIGVLLRGGLGNQMFQYALGLKIALMHQLPLLLDTRELVSSSYEGQISQGRVMRTFSLGYLPITMQKPATPLFDKQYAAASENRLNFTLKNFLFRSNRIYRELGFNFSELNLSKMGSGAYLVGYWQSYRYFSDISRQIRQEFVLPHEDLPKNVQLLAKQIEELGGICLNVRRGDFATNKVSNDFHGCLPFQYYVNALDELSAKIGKSKIFLFTDDLKWSSEKFSSFRQIHIVDHSFAGPSFVHYLNLMRHCRGFVVPNSTFGWWAAWLALGNSEKVIAPKNWFRNAQLDTSDLIPPLWKRI